MKTNRRNFLKASGFSLIGVIGLSFSPNQVFGFSQGLANLNAGSFSTLIGTNFTLYKNDSAIESVLSEVKTYAPNKSTKSKQSGFVKTTKTNSFRLIFRVPDNNLEQDFYQIFHPSIGLFNLLLVPGNTENGAPTLSAVINRL